MVYRFKVRYVIVVLLGICLIAVLVGLNGSVPTSSQVQEKSYIKWVEFNVSLSALEDAMALDTSQIAAGQVTATQIKAAYEPLNEKCDDFEYCINEFIGGILDVLGIDDTVSFTRSTMSNRSEEVNALLAGAEYLSQEYITEKLLTFYGDIDRVEEVLNQIADDSMSRLSGGEE